MASLSSLIYSKMMGILHTQVPFFIEIVVDFCISCNGFTCGTSEIPFVFTMVYLLSKPLCSPWYICCPNHCVYSDISAVYTITLILATSTLFNQRFPGHPPISFSQRRKLENFACKSKIHISVVHFAKQQKD